MQLSPLITKEPLTYKIKMQPTNRQSILNFRTDEDVVQYILEQMPTSQVTSRN